MAVHLVTGFKGEEHIQSADQGSFNASFFGDGEFVMEAGNQCEASIINNNTVRILDGDILMKGRHIRIPSNTYIDMTIQTGTAGVNRNDLIVMEYSKDAGSGIESADLKVIKGTAVEGTASDPAFTSGDILGGAILNQMPLYRVKVEGVVLASVEQICTVIPTYKKLAEQYAKQFEEACNTYLGALNILDSKEEIEANTKENQLAGALALKEVIASLSQIIEDNATIQYIHGTTDEIQIKDDSGNWHKYASGGLNAFDVNTLSLGEWEISSSNLDFSVNPFNAKAKTTGGTYTVTTVNGYELGKYSKLVLSGTVRTHQSNASDAAYTRVQLINSATGDLALDYYFANIDNDTDVTLDDFAIPIDLAEGIEYKIRVLCKYYTSSIYGQLAASKFRFTN
jgi:hypothetical protein